jgi:hypothetical protein
MLMPRYSGPPPWSDSRDKSSGDKRSTRSSGTETSRHISAFTPSWPEERRIRREIDRAVGRALVDHSFAARLLTEPALAMHAEVCGHAQYPAVCSLWAQDLADFARQMLAQFWGPAQGSIPAPQPSNGSFEANHCTSRTACLCARSPTPSW